jgi:D-threo-aldose 1-dehydrogenase
MNQVKIPQFSITTTKVGFGCSSIVGMVSEKEARRLIDAAYHAGIRHFDVARSYGHGAAESVLGRALGKRRPDVTIASKFGLAVPGRRVLIDLARTVLRPVARRFSTVRSQSRSAPAGVIKTLEFSRPNAERSLETTLRELGTDYLDIFLLHEANADALCYPELLEFLEGAVRAGKIRGYGVGTDLRNLGALMLRQPEYCKIVQHEWSVLTGSVAIPQNSFRITHGALAKAFGTTRERLRDDPGTARAAGIDLTKDEQLSGILLRSVALEFPASITLFSARSPERILANTEALFDTRFDTPALLLSKLLKTGGS